MDAEFNILARKKPHFHKILDNAIKVPVPDVRQRTNFSCGAACVQAICAYWGTGPDNEWDYIKHLKSDDRGGTLPKYIIQYLKKKKIQVEAKENMTLDDLKANMDKGRPVICAIQAWGNSKVYNKNSNGHYVVVIGYDDRHIFIEDPSINLCRGYIANKQFLNRWHDVDALGNLYTHYGIAAWKSEPPAYYAKAMKIG